MSYIQSTLKGDRNDMVEKVMRNTLEERSDAWNKDARKNMKCLGITVTRIQGISKKEMGKKMVKIRKTIQSISRYLYNALQIYP